jgi:hypothetical protein
MFNSSVEEEWGRDTVKEMLIALARHGHVGDGEQVAREVLTALKKLREFSTESEA